MDQIRINNLKVFAHHGVYPEEAQQGQDFFVDVVLDVDTRYAGKTDDLTQTADYGDISMFIDKYMKKNTFKLLETVTENLAREILLRYELVHQIEICIKKPYAPIPLPFEDVSVTKVRGWHTAYIALGSNMGSREDYIADALDALEEEVDVYVEKTSTIIETEPYGDVATDVFLNGVVKVKTLLTPRELLEVCHKIENNAGRERTEHWGNRTLDLDILFYDDLIMNEEDLIIPHVDIKNRDFVLIPMNEIAPGFVHPLYRLTMKDMLEDIK